MVRKYSEDAIKRKRDYDKQYIKEKIRQITISFNAESEEDAKIREWLDSKGRGKITGYIKGLIKEDMQKAGE